MQSAAIPGYRLGKSKKSTKILITLGLLGLFLGLLGAALLTISRVGLSPSSVRAYYLGHQAQADELSAMLAANQPRSFAELAEVTHMHLVGGSMLLFFLCHLLSVCSLGENWRSAIYIAAFASFIGTFGLPWLIVYLSPVFACLFAPTMLAFLLSLLILVLIPLREIWFTPSIQLSDATTNIPKRRVGLGRS